MTAYLVHIAKTTEYTGTDIPLVLFLLKSNRFHFSSDTISAGEIKPLLATQILITHLCVIQEMHPVFPSLLFFLR